MEKDSLTLSIGIPVRNESRNLTQFIFSLIDAVEALRSAFPELSIETLFCVNDTTDDSPRLIQLLALPVLCLNAQLIESSPGKINAIMEISRLRNFQGVACFMDADILLEKDCLVNLFKDFLESETFLVYSSVHAVTKRESFMQKVQKAHYRLRHDVTPRNYFHGRTYLLRDTNVFAENFRTSEAGRNWNLDHGPLVEDIYLSRVIAHEYGLSGMRENSAAKVYFVPPKTLGDFYLGQRRLLMEIHRLNLLYPEHSYVQKKHFKKKVKWSYFLDRNVSLKHFVKYLIYFSIEESVRLLVRLEMFLISIGVLKCKKIWKPIHSTKTLQHELR